MPAYKDSSGKWYVQFRYKDSFGKSKATTKRGFKTKKEALKYERQFLEKTKYSLDMSLEDFTDIYFQDKKKELKERTVQNKKYMIKKYIIPKIGKMKVSEVTTADIVHWQNHIVDLGLSATYQRMLDNQLRALFSHAVKIYNLKESPCKRAGRIGAADAKHIDYWELDEYNQFIASFDNGDKYIVLFDMLFWTGIRIGEALALTENDFDFSKNTVTISKTYFRNKGKDLITEPKTEGSNRKVAIPEFLKTEIENYILRLYKYPKTERLFPVTIRAVEKVMVRHIMKCDGLNRIRVHDLRHSHASVLINNGVQPKMIQERLGHSSITMTLNKYSHLYESEQQRLVEALEKIKNDK